MSIDRRLALSILGVTLPAGFLQAMPLLARSRHPVLRFRDVESDIRAAFQGTDRDESPRCRIAIGHSELLHAGIAGCHNAKRFAGFAAGRLRIVATGCEPGPMIGGVRLFTAWIEVVRTHKPAAIGGRPLDFTLLPPAPFLADAAHNAPDHRQPLLPSG